MAKKFAILFDIKGEKLICLVKFYKQLSRGILTFITVYIIFTLIFAFCVISDNTADFWMIPQQCAFFFSVVRLFLYTVILLDVGGHLFSDLTDKKRGHLKIHGFPLVPKNNV